MSAVPDDDRRLDRLRWKARRGLLENDLLLSKFLQAELTNLSIEELDTLDALLQLSDNDLLDLLMGRKSSPDVPHGVESGAAVAAMVKRIVGASPAI